MPLDDADKKFISELISTSLNAANEETAKLINGTVTTAIKGLDLDKKLDSVKTDLDKKLEASPPKPDDKGKKPDDKGGQAIDDHPEFKKLQAKVREQEEAAARAEADRRANLLRNSVQESLVAGGADPKRTALAIEGIIARGLVRLDDKGQPKFVAQRSWGEELVDPSAGAKEWLSTDDGKLLVPPVGTQGTGDRGGQLANTQPSTAPRTKDGAVDWSALAGKAQVAAALSSAD